jgi:calcineurin-like phosphoesterase family protein
LDTHFFHTPVRLLRENIGRYCSPPENWQDLIIQNWNDLVSPNEPMFHLGDLSFGRKANFELLTSVLHGRLILLRGNHDRLSRTYYEAHGVKLFAEPLQIEYQDHLQLVFSHRPIVPLLEGVINLHGHIHNNPPPSEGSNLGPHHINMCVEVRVYRPWRLEDVPNQSLS